MLPGVDMFTMRRSDDPDNGFYSPGHPAFSQCAVALEVPHILW